MINIFFRCSLWLRYGQLIEDQSIVCVNFFGAMLQISYALVYCMYCLKKSHILKQFVIATILLLFVYAYSFYAEDKNLVTKHVGLMSCSLTIMFFASPLISLVSNYTWNFFSLYNIMMFYLLDSRNENE